MGTRNVTILISEGKTRIAQYGQFDGYPEGAGLSILDFLKNTDLNSYKNIVKECIWVDDEMDVLSNNRNLGWKSLKLPLSGELQFIDNTEFAKEGLHCEWGYVIDLDKNAFEVYKGFGKDPISEDERFYFEGYKFGFDMFGYDYYPIKKIAEFDIKDLPDKQRFLDQCETKAKIRPM